MKKFASLFLSTIVAASVLTGCGNTGVAPSGSNGSDSSSSQASSESRVGYPDEDGNAEGRLGDTMHTYFFDYTVNSAYVCDEYEGYAPQDGNELLVADITVKNTFSESIEMYDSDFQIQWNDDADDAYDVPITYYFEDGQPLNDQMLPGTYDLSINQTVNGILVFEVPAGNKDFSISYLEMFDDDSSGDVFFVYFSADKQ